ncbi:pseudouridine synthase [Schumannella soli]|uniref:Pseudouridine synthase n=1 Tax=Schumannella soli TaxID=2590779 RepID=A0A506Y393_9MICO|nr:rRNA pseudouridine synthase [Schumannella soli]
MSDHSGFNDGNDPHNPAGERLQKVLAAAGVASRRVCEEYIASGRVEVNGQVVTELGTRIDPLVDLVSVDGTAIQLDPGKRYVMLNKPTGVISTMSDEKGRPDLREFTVDYEERLFNVGRLDADTSGLLLLTNDGDLAQVLAHPSFGVEKTYIATVRGEVFPNVLRTLEKGIELDDGPIRADRARLIGEPSKGQSMVEITLHSGRNRIVRRMLDAVGHPVDALVRRQFGPLHLGTLGLGRSRDLSTLELGRLLTISRAGGVPGSGSGQDARRGGKPGAKKDAGQARSRQTISTKSTGTTGGARRTTARPDTRNRRP